ncbi:MAG: hypothetical protein JG767_248 [Deferribacteraceae bacterium]|nr:hypothetical protein [Deferribacteraceae bacterium]
MHIIFRQHDQFFSVEDNFVEMFMLSKHYYTISIVPDFINGFENIKGDIYPIISIFGIVNKEPQKESPLYLLKLKEPYNMLLYSTVKPNLIEILENTPKVEMQANLKGVCNFAFRMGNDTIYNLNLNKIENSLIDYQKYNMNGDAYDKKSI